MTAERSYIVMIPLPLGMTAWIRRFYSGNPRWHEVFDRDISNHFAIYQFGFFSGDPELESAAHGIRDLWQREKHRTDFTGELEELPVVFTGRMDQLEALADYAGTTAAKLLQIAAGKAFEERVGFVISQDGYRAAG